MHLFRVCSVQVMVIIHSHSLMVLPPLSSCTTALSCLRLFCPHNTSALKRPTITLALIFAARTLDQAYIRFYGPSGYFSVIAPLTRSNNLFKFQTDFLSAHHTPLISYSQLIVVASTTWSSWHASTSPSSTMQHWPSF